MSQQNDFFSTYFKYVEDTESPTIFHRWSVIASIGALLGRNYSFPHGHFLVNPNIYCMLIGSPGTRKSTSIKTIRNLLSSSGYLTIAAEKTSQQKFLLDLDGREVNEKGYIVSSRTRRTQGKEIDEILEENLWGNGEGEDLDSRPPVETFIMADEFNDFFGNNNIEFISLLGNLWDFNGVYRSRIKNGTSVAIPNPTISILGGNTPTGFASAFPTDIIGQGFFSRILLIYGESSGRRIAFPKKPDTKDTEFLVEMIHLIKKCASGVAQTSTGARQLLEKSYNTWKGVDDVRFESYGNRRFTHLLKMCLITSAARYSNKIEEQDVVYANTILSHTESYMPKALGEFGKARNSDISHKILVMLDKALEPVTFKAMWKEVHNDLDKMNDLTTLLQNLIQADKIQVMKNGNGFLAKKKLTEEDNSDLLDYSLLTDEERNMTR